MLLFVSGVKTNTQLAKPAFFSTGPSCSRARRAAFPLCRGLLLRGPARSELHPILHGNGFFQLTSLIPGEPPA